MSIFSQIPWLQLGIARGARDRLKEGLGMSLNLFSGGTDYYNQQAPSSDGLRQAEERRNHERATLRLIEQQRENERRRADEEQARINHERQKELVGLRGNERIEQIEKSAALKPKVVPKPPKVETFREQRARDQFMKEQREAELRNYQATGFGTDENAEQKVAYDPSDLKRKADRQSRIDNARAMSAEAQKATRAVLTRLAESRDKRSGERHNERRTPDERDAAAAAKRANQDARKREADARRKAEDRFKAYAESAGLDMTDPIFREQERQRLVPIYTRDILKQVDKTQPPTGATPEVAPPATIPSDEGPLDPDVEEAIREIQAGGGAPSTGGSMVPDGAGVGGGGEPLPVLPGFPMPDGDAVTEEPIRLAGLPRESTPAANETDEIIAALRTKSASEMISAVKQMADNPDAFRAKGIDVDRVVETLLRDQPWAESEGRFVTDPAGLRDEEAYVEMDGRRVTAADIAKKRRGA